MAQMRKNFMLGVGGILVAIAMLPFILMILSISLVFPPVADSHYRVINRAKGGEEE